MWLVAAVIESINKAAKTGTQEAEVRCFAVTTKKGSLCFGKIHSNFLICWDLKPKSICSRLAVCHYRPGFQAPPVLGKLNWQFSILFRSEGHAADSKKNINNNRKNTNKKHTDQTGRKWSQRATTLEVQTDSTRSPSEAILSNFLLPERTGSEKSRELEI